MQEFEGDEDFLLWSDLKMPVVSNRIIFYRTLGLGIEGTNEAF